MNPLAMLRNIFKKKSQDSTEETHKWNEAYDAYEEGKKLFSAKKYQESIDSFDKVIESRFDHYFELYFKDVYEYRARSLQSLNFDFDAIDDLNQAISLAPENQDIYFMRSLSRSTIGDFAGSISDLQEAIRLSRVVNENSQFWNDYAKETGYPSAAAYYETHLTRVQMNKELYEEHPDAWQRRLERNPIHRRKEPNPNSQL